MEDTQDMDETYITEYFALLNELEALMTGDPMPDSPEGVRAQELITLLMKLDES